MMFCTLVEETVYGKTHDSVIKQGMRNNRTAEDLVELSSIATLYNQIVETNAAEVDAGVAARTATEATEATDGASGSGPRTEPDDPFAEDVNKVGDDAKDEIMRYKTMCKRSVTAHISLVTRPRGGMKAFSEFLRGHPASAAQADKKTLIFYASSMSGEAVTNSQTRKPPLRSHYKECIQAMLESRAKPNEVAPEDVYAAFDGGKAGSSHQRATKTSTAITDDTNDKPQSSDNRQE